MAERRLSPDEAALWARVLANVRPIRLPKPAAPRAADPPAPPVAASRPGRQRADGMPARHPDPVANAPARTAAKRPACKMNATLDGRWDRQLARGLVAPDRAVDLHGHNLATAHATLDRALGDAVLNGDRVVLLVTGKPPRPSSERPYARGAIRAAVGDWLAGSRHAGAIAAVRNAHPRHGGAGALYIILRRGREGPNY